MEEKGYYTGGDYYGFINGKYQKFETEDEYHEALKEIEDKENDTP